MEEGRVMALVACSECGREISARAPGCIGCGAPLVAAGSIEARGGERPQAQRESMASTGPRSRSLLWISLILALGLIGTLAWNMASKKPAPHTRPEALATHSPTAQANLLDAIEQCEKRYTQMNSDRQYTAADLRVYAQVCKQLRADYKERWGFEP